MPVSITNKLYSFVNGTANDADPVDAEITNLHTNDAALAVFTDASALGNVKEGLALTLRSDFTGTPATGDNGLLGVERGTSANVYLRWNEEFDRWESTQDGTNYIIFASTLTADPSTPVDGSFWYNSSSDEFKGRSNGTTATFITSVAGSSYPRSYQASARPVYVSASTFSVASVACRNTANTGDITKTTSTTVDISTTGINGVAQNGANLVGTITVTNGAATVVGVGTSFLTDFVVNDYFTTAGGVQKQIATIVDDLNMTVTVAYGANEAGVTYSRTLPGTITVNNGSSAIAGSGTAFATDFVIGDVIRTAGGQLRKITNVASNIAMTAESNFTSNEAAVAYKRGGEAINTWYYLYAIDNGPTPGLLLSPRNVIGGNTLVDKPSGYSSVRQLPFAVRNDASGNIIPFYIASGWPHNPEVMYRVSQTNYNGSTNTGTTNVKANGSDTSYTDIDLASFVPTISDVCHLACATTGLGFFSIRQNGDSTVGQMVQNSSTSNTGIMSVALFPQQTDASQIIEYNRLSGSTGIYIDVMGFTVTSLI